MTHLLKKLFKVRDKLGAKYRGNPEREMPFLEHLEELRGTLVKIILTLVVAMVAAFVFHNQLLDLMRYPVQLAGLDVPEVGPKGLDAKQWAECKRVAKVARLLPEAQQASFFDEIAKDKDLAPLRPFMPAFGYYQASVALPYEARQGFLESVVTDPKTQEICLELVRHNPKATLDRDGNLITMSALKPTEPFMLSIKLSLYAGIVISLPLLLFFIAQFVFPGLTEKEKGVILPAIGVAVVLFLIGAVFSYWVVTPEALKFFHKFSGEMGVSTDWRIGEYVSLVTSIVLAFGLSFELPVVVMIFVKLGLLSYETMSKNRSYAIVIIVTVAAIITPTPDALVLSLLSVPLIILYEICIWMAYYLRKQELKREAQEEAERALRRKSLRPVVDLSPAALASASSASTSDSEPGDPPKRGEDYEEGFGPRDETAEGPKVTPASEIVPVEQAPENSAAERDAEVDGPPRFEEKNPSDPTGPSSADATSATDESSPS